MRAQDCSTQNEMSVWLWNTLFPGHKQNDKIDLADKWKVDTVDGHQYLKENGLYVISKALSEFRYGNTPLCSLAHRDMRSDLLGVPVATGLQCSLLDSCCKEENVSMDLLHTAMHYNVLTEKCMDLMYPEKKETVLPDIESTALADTDVTSSVTIHPNDISDSLPDVNASDQPLKRKRRKT